MGARAEDRGSPRGTHHSNDADIHTFIIKLPVNMSGSCQALGNFLTRRLKFCEKNS